MAVQPQHVHGVLDELASFCGGKNTKRAKDGHLCVTPTICVFVITSHCLLGMMNKRLKRAIIKSKWKLVRRRKKPSQLQREYLSDGICLLYDCSNLQVSSIGSSRRSHGYWLSRSHWFQAEGLVSYLL
jgi:hypothetical protein